MHSISYRVSFILQVQKGQSTVSNAYQRAVEVAKQQLAKAQAQYAAYMEAHPETAQKIDNVSSKVGLALSIYLAC